MDQLLVSIRQIISQSRESTARSINHALTLMYWQIGRVIVEEEQQGNERADYGKALIKNLSVQLVADYGENLSSRNLQLSRQLYLTFPIVSCPDIGCQFSLKIDNHARPHSRPAESLSVQRTTPGDGRVSHPLWR